MVSHKSLMWMLLPVIAAGAALGTAPAHAQRYHGAHWWHPGPSVHVDIGPWYHGHWRHGPRYGRLGWWWVVGGAWYFYPSPIYPYPNPYIPPIAGVPQLAAPAGPPPQQYWYYCQSNGTYYPYVSSCAEGWQKVPAAPPPPSE